MIIDWSQHVYEAPCRYYAEGPVSSIRYYWVSKDNPILEIPTAFAQNPEPQGPSSGMIGQLYLRGERNFRLGGWNPNKLDGEHYEGTLADFAGAGIDPTGGDPGLWTTDNLPHCDFPPLRRRRSLGALEIAGSSEPVIAGQRIAALGNLSVSGGIRGISQLVSRLTLGGVQVNGTLAGLKKNFDLSWVRKGKKKKKQEKKFLSQRISPAVLPPFVPPEPIVYTMQTGGSLEVTGISGRGCCKCPEEFAYPAWLRKERKIKAKSIAMMPRKKTSPFTLNNSTPTVAPGYFVVSEYQDLLVSGYNAINWGTPVDYESCLFVNIVAGSGETITMPPDYILLQTVSLPVHSLVMNLYWCPNVTDGRIRDIITVSPGTSFALATSTEIRSLVNHAIDKLVYSYGSPSSFSQPSCGPTGVTSFNGETVLGFAGGWQNAEIFDAYWTGGWTGVTSQPNYYINNTIGGVFNAPSASYSFSNLEMFQGFPYENPEWATIIVTVS